MSEQSETAVTRAEPFFSDLDLFRRREPFRSMLDRFFGELSEEFPSEVRVSSPRVDVTESDDAYHVRAELAGVSKDDVTVELTNGLLSIRGEKKSRRDDKTEKGRRLECAYGAFSRSLSLPQDADADRVTAEFKDGVLEIAIQKSPEAKPKQIAVKG